jgi:predicted permease
VLAVLGGVIGLGVGRLGLLGLASLGGMDEIPRSAEIGMDWQVVAITMVAATIAGLLFGLAPLARVARGDLSTIFRQEGRGGTASRGALSLRGGLVIAQVALAFTLLAGTGLLLASLSRTLRVDPGFRIDNILTAAISMPSSRYPERAPADFLGRALTSARGLPGVRSAAATSELPFSGDMSSSAITPEGYRLAQGESPLSVPNRRVTPGYFETLGIPIVRGRDFGSQDGPESTDVVIIDEWLAHRYWPNRDPIGQRIFQGVYGAQPDSAIEWMTIVGVAGVTRINSLAGDEPQGHYYLPLAQAGARSVQLVLATSTDPTSVAAPLRGLISGLDPDMPVYQIRTMEERVGQSLVNERGRVTLLVAFAAVALFLAAIGLYGVLAYSVTLRTREIGLRLALGSGTGEVFGLVLRHGLRLLVFGLASGAAISLALSRLIRGMLYGVAPTDPLVFTVVLTLLGGAATLACVIPARRATRVHPMTALTVD